ncbi:type 2 lactosamine alpha-2,3-sialyltransferase isoform X7 [Chrysemys picta bellii]|uniref:type 2 lactosamine alpha-2,3-sialyltransferase isoform X7 n=1 Tax=Chrysemys picta bellii TaxID=8478 RepID=UPI0032B2B4E3
MTGLPVMKRILLVVLLAAAAMYVILHCNLWKTNVYLHSDTCLPLKLQHEPQTRGRQAEEHISSQPDLNRLPPTATRRKSGLENCSLDPPFESLWNVICRRCVVVGNGGVLRNKTLGEKIDSYDVVIRMNNGPVRGYEEDVGKRTTFRLFYPESVFSDPIHYDPDTTVVLLVFKPHDLKWLWNILNGHKINTNGFWKKPALKMIYKVNQIRILDPIIIRKTAHEWLQFPTKFPRKEKPKHPTTGLIAITLAFHICNEVHVAGFKYNFADRNSSLHYYGNETMSEMIENGYHNIIAEQKFLKSLVEKQFVVSLT